MFAESRKAGVLDLLERGVRDIYWMVVTTMSINDFLR